MKDFEEEAREHFELWARAASQWWAREISQANELPAPSRVIEFLVNRAIMAHWDMHRRRAPADWPEDVPKLVITSERIYNTRREIIGAWGCFLTDLWGSSNFGQNLIPPAGRVAMVVQYEIVKVEHFGEVTVLK